MKLRLLICCSFLFLVTAGSGFGIGRSGNGSSLVSDSLGFRADAPKAFPEIRLLEGEALRLRFPGVEFLNGAMIQPFIEVSPISKLFPEVREWSRAQVEEHFNSIGWVKAQGEDSCIDIYRQPESQVFIAIWGIGKGISVIGPDSSNVKVGIREILGTLRLSVGACSW